ncbi:DUF7518 family protein [Haloarchaeobius sp. TZWWS8]|uniref:DUF7518 family protein n=1 Tax=Haloarchaeobius sp. TZWWS8 TaxID=3446121 RepID=UPI003EBA2587
MPKNRVESLEATVNELESTVRGLTEELVETKERVRILEAELEADPRSVAPDTSSDEPEMLTPEPGSAEAAQSDVEAAAADASSEDAKNADAESEEESEESGLGDDIIVA